MVTEGREGWGRIGGREIAGLRQRVSPTTHQVGVWGNWRKGWGAFSRIVWLSSKTPIRALQNFERIKTQARPYWRNKKEAGVQILSSGKPLGSPLRLPLCKECRPSRRSRCLHDLFPNKGIKGLYTTQSFWQVLHLDYTHQLVGLLRRKDYGIISMLNRFVLDISNWNNEIFFPSTKSS